MNDSQKIVLQIAALLIAAMIIFPPLNYEGYGLIFDLQYGFQDIAFGDLMVRLLIVILLAFVAFLNFSVPEEKRLLNFNRQKWTDFITEYRKGEKSFLVTALLSWGDVYFLYLITYHIFGPLTLRGLFIARSEFSQIRAIATVNDDITIPFVIMLLFLTIYTLCSIQAFWNASKKLSHRLLGFIFQLSAIFGTLICLLVGYMTYGWLLGYINLK